MSETGNDEKEADHHPYRRPNDAATLILVDRSCATPKVLVGKRHDKVVFMPGKFVFPGGRVDKTDNRVPVAAPIPKALEAKPAEGQPEDRSLARPLAGDRRDPRGLRGNRPLPRAQGQWRGASISTAPGSLRRCRPVARPVRAVSDRARDHPARPRPAVRHPVLHRRRLQHRPRVEGVIHADAELVELVWVELGSKPLADLHPMTRNVLDELERRLATGPLRPRCADAVFPFLRRQDAEGYFGGVINASPRPRATASPLSLEERRLRRVSKDEATAGASWFETAQVRLLTMR